MLRTASAIVPVAVASALLTGSVLRGARLPVPTYEDDIAPLVSRHCVACHQPGGAAPFSLQTYEDVRRRATLAADLVQRGRMPPWLPVQGEDTFVGARKLSDVEKQLFSDWVAAGLPRGTPRTPGAEAPDARTASAEPPEDEIRGDGADTSWGLGDPDLMAGSSEPFLLPADGGDVYRTIVVPVPTRTRRYVRGLEFRTTAPSAVHHAVIGTDRTGTARWLDRRDASPGFDGRLTGPARSPDGQFLGWTPGRRPALLPDDLAWTLDPGTDLVVQLHLVPTGKPERISVQLGLHFTDTAPARRPVLVRVGSLRIDIPAGAGRHTTRDAFVLPVDVEVLSIYPHAHLLATQVAAHAVEPEGASHDLLRIDRWDFSWQDEYRYVRPIRLPRGTRLTAAFTYDNSARNPARTATTPQRVLYGPRTTDEMGDIWLQVTTRSAQDRALLVRTLTSRDLEANIDAYERLVRARPGDAEHHLTLGTLYGARGDAGAAVVQYREALRLSPGDVLPKYNLAVGLQAIGDHTGAERLLLDVVAIEPGHAEALHALGHAALARGDLPAARTRFEGALSVWPGFADAHASLGTLLARLGQPADAEAAFRRALAAAPDHLAALNNLAILLAGRGAVAEAIALLERAVDLDPGHAPSRQNLAAARDLAGR